MVPRTGTDLVHEEASHASSSMRAPLLVIASVALGAISIALAGCDSQAPPETVRLTVLTLNLDAGADLALVEDDARPSDLRVIEFYTALVESNPAGRAVRAADAIAEALPDVVALQEVMTVRSEYPADWTPGSAPDAETPRYDVLPGLLDSLRARGAVYQVVSEAVTSDWERTARVGPSDADIRFTERVVLLARIGVDAVDLGDLDLAPRTLLVAGETIEADTRAAVASVEGVQVATFRLDSTDPHAAAKTVALTSDLEDPVIVAAHVGTDGADSPLRSLQEQGFVDAWAYLVGAGGQTCCRSTSDPASLRRADVISGRGEPILFLDVSLFPGRGISRYEGVFSELTVW